jgi:formylglycine-generating enzyme required for sulfatase activity/tRNA A-37 threonylcarbamoyl transferase component Bud32
MINVTCSKCGLRILVPPTVQGRQGLCFGCGGAVQVPSWANPNKGNELHFAPGQRISDRYLVEEQLGSGGMSVVYRAQDTLVHETVALKFMKPLLLSTQRGQRLFIQEAQIARRLRHGNIVGVHDAGCTADGILYLSMEYVDGRSLRALLREYREKQRLLDVRFAVAVAAQVLDALHYAHDLVTHRDIKPENIMILPGERVKVLDFGLARVLDEEAVTRVDENEVEGLIGTQAYAAPEQLAHHEIDHRADIYAMGHVLHELLTLRTPIDEPVEILQARDDVSPEFVQVVRKAIEEDKQRRWSDAAAFAEALHQAFEELYHKVAAPNLVSDGGAGSTEGMVFMEGGRFLMGNDAQVREAPQFEAEVAPFYIDAHPVTNAQYAHFVEETGHEKPVTWEEPDFSGSQQPVTGVTWEDANAYAAWAGKQLPSEAQWEFAARGKANRRYPWGIAEPDSTRANFGDDLNMPSRVGLYDEGASPDGVHDLAGNVAEWTLDCFMPYDTEHRGDVVLHGAPRRVIRGGSWNAPATELRSSFRRGLFPQSRENTVGFRCVLPVKGN